jgi:hypothetical protein
MAANPERSEDEESSSEIINLKDFRKSRDRIPVTFQRSELDAILRVYSRMVAAGEWRDYAIDHLKDRAVFSVFRRTSEVPMFRIEKHPKLSRRQGAFSVTAASGLIVKRGQDLAQVLRIFDKALRVVKG